MKARAPLSLTGALAIGLISGCQASLNADASAGNEGAKARAEAEADVNGSADEGKGEMVHSATGPTPGSALASSTTDVGTSRVLLGARHDLKLRPGKATANCQCLSVALGGSHNASMVWSAVPPDIDEGSQLTIALSSDGQMCKDEPKKSLGASYWGYRLSGNDVVVLVEAAKGGRPLTVGAVIPKPVGPGQVYVAPASKNLPYGKPLEGKGLCKIGNPGQVRSAPFTELEVGSDAPPRSSSSGVVGEQAVSDHSGDTPMTIELPSQ